MNTFPGFTIRGLRADDWEGLFVLWENEQVLLNSTELPYRTDDIVRDYLNNLSDNTHALVAEANLSSGRTRIVGLALLAVLSDRRRHTGQLKMMLQPDYYGTNLEAGLLQNSLVMADEWLGLRRVEAKLYVDLADTISLYQEHGFVIEATMRRYALRRGVLSDVHLMARLHVPTSPPSEEPRTS